MRRIQVLGQGWPLAAVGILALWTPTDDGLTLCPFALLTGTACPGCGLSRALAWMVRGDLARSWSYHPVAGLLALEIAAGWGLWMLRRRGRAAWLQQRWVDAALLGTAVLLVVVWVLRWISGTLPPV